jgi:hypothetical protein
LTINDQTNTTSNCGLFGVIGNNDASKSAAIISNVRLVNVNISVVKAKVGALVGQIYIGHVINCSSSGTLTSNKGGLGGLVGQCQGGGLIKASYSNCSLTQTAVSQVGVLLGLNQGTVIECYAKGTASGLESVGGLIGANSASVSSSYANSSVSLVSGTNSRIGWLVGFQNTGTINNGVYWNTSLGATGVGSRTGGTNNSSGITSDNLKIIGSFLTTRWDFAGATSDGSRDVWSFGSDGFPTVSRGTNYWKGSSTDWSATGNWSKNVKPTITSFDTTSNNSIIFPTGLSNYPTLGENETLSSATLVSGSSINLSSFNLTVDNKLINDGTITTASSGQVIISSSGTLSGSGALPSTSINGAHSPGSSPGLQTINGNLTYNAGADINWELMTNSVGTRGVDYDAIDVTGNLDFAGATDLNLILTEQEVVWIGVMLFGQTPLLE